MDNRQNTARILDAEEQLLVSVPEHQLDNPGQRREMALGYARRFRNGCGWAAALSLLYLAGPEPLFKGYLPLLWALSLLAAAVVGAWTVASWIGRDVYEARESLFDNTWQWCIECSDFAQSNRVMQALDDFGYTKHRQSKIEAT